MRRRGRYDAITLPPSAHHGGAQQNGNDVPPRDGTLENGTLCLCGECATRKRRLARSTQSENHGQDTSRIIAWTACAVAFAREFRRGKFTQAWHASCCGQPSNSLRVKCREGGRPRWRTTGWIMGTPTILHKGDTNHFPKGGDGGSVENGWCPWTAVQPPPSPNPLLRLSIVDFLKPPR